MARASTSDPSSSLDQGGGETAPFAAMIDFSHNHFELLGIAPRFRIDPAALDEAYRALQTQVHPDRFAGGSESQRRMALQASARVNEAYQRIEGSGAARAVPAAHQRRGNGRRNRYAVADGVPGASARAPRSRRRCARSGRRARARPRWRDAVRADAASAGGPARARGSTPSTAMPMPAPMCGN